MKFQNQLFIKASLAFALLVLIELTDLKAQSGNLVAIDTSNFDFSYKTEDDFYNYVNGNWLKNNSIPPGNSSWGTFSVVDQQQAEILKSLIEEIAIDNNAIYGSDRQIIRDFYLAAMDSVTIEKQKSIC